MVAEPQSRPHFVLQNTSKTEPYTSPSSGGSKVTVPPLERPQHAAALRAQLHQVAAAQEQRVAQSREANVQTGIGIQVEFESLKGVALAAASLARDSQGIELMNARERDGHVLATVFVPEGKLTHFERLLEDYINGAKCQRRLKSDPLSVGIVGVNLTHPGT